MIFPEPEPSPTAMMPLPSGETDSKVPLPEGAVCEVQFDPVVQVLAQRRTVGPAPTTITLESPSTATLVRLLVFPVPLTTDQAPLL